MSSLTCYTTINIWVSELVGHKVQDILTSNYLASCTTVSRDPLTPNNSSSGIRCTE